MAVRASTSKAPELMAVRASTSKAPELMVRASTSEAPELMAKRASTSEAPELMAEPQSHNNRQSVETSLFKGPVPITAPRVQSASASRAPPKAMSSSH